LDDRNLCCFVLRSKTAGANVYKKQHIIEQNGQWFDSFDWFDTSIKLSAGKLTTGMLKTGSLTIYGRRKTDDGGQKTEEWMTDDGREKIDEKQTTNVEHPT
jgi:hypothetical protein